MKTEKQSLSLSEVNKLLHDKINVKLGCVISRVLCKRFPNGPTYALQVNSKSFIIKSRRASLHTVR